MPIPFEADSLDALPEALREHYVERDGKLVLDVDGLEDVSRLKAALQKERQLHRDAERRLAALQKELEAARPRDEERVETLRKQLAEYERQLEETRRQAERERAIADLTRRAVAAGADARHLPHLLKLIDGRWELRDGEMIFLDEHGRPTADDADAFFGRRLPKEFPFFYGRQAMGSGAPHTAQSGVSLTRESIGQMTPEEIRARWSDVKKALGG